MFRRPGTYVKITIQRIHSVHIIKSSGKKVNGEAIIAGYNAMGPMGRKASQGVGIHSRKGY